jgi:hypothetical protein
MAALVFIRSIKANKTKGREVRKQTKKAYDTTQETKHH